MARSYLQGKFVPTNPEKYIGDLSNIIFRSSWERKAMIRFDTDPSILKWSSEELVVSYVSPADSRPHRYFIDFVIEYRTKTGAVEKAAIEVKPEIQTKPPVIGKRKTKQLMEAIETYAVNQAKWEAARAWCKKHNMHFFIFTEKTLNIR